MQRVYALSSVASDLGLQCLPSSILRDARQKGGNGKNSLINVSLRCTVRVIIYIWVALGKKRMSKRTEIRVLFVLRFYGSVNPLGSCRAHSVYLTTLFPGQA